MGTLALMYTIETSTSHDRPDFIAVANYTMGFAVFSLFNVALRWALILSLRGDPSCAGEHAAAQPPPPRSTPECACHFPEAPKMTRATESKALPLRAGAGSNTVSSLRVEEVGPLPLRAPVGHGARGLQCERRRLELLHARSGALAGVQVGRGRHRRHLGRPPATLLGAGAVERQGPDHQGAAVRAGQLGRQPWRGRQGVLLLPRFDADALVHEVSLQVPAGGLSLRRHRAHQRAAFARGSRVRVAGYRRLRRRPLLRCLRRICQGQPGRPADPHRGGQPGAGSRRPASAAATVVPQHLVARPGRRRGDAAAARLAGERRGPGRAGHRGQPPGTRGLLPVRRGRADAPVYRQRDQSATRLRYREHDALREGRDQRLSRRRPGRRRQSRRSRAARPPCCTY
jgi:hypothetical protein